MNSKESAITVKAKNIEEALSKAELLLGVPKSKITYEQLKKGVVSSLFSSKIEVLVWINQASESSKNHYSNKRPNTSGNRVKEVITTSELEIPKKLTPEQLEQLPIELKDFCLNIVKDLVSDVEFIETSYDSVFGLERLVLDVKSQDFEKLLKVNSKVAEALEHLLRKKPRHLKQELPFRVMVDANGVRRKHEIELQQVASDLSEKVAQNLRPIVLNYKSAYDRKIIHMALDKDARVSTRSVGSGSNRKLMIVPSKGESFEKPLEISH